MHQELDLSYSYGYQRSVGRGKNLENLWGNGTFMETLRALTWLMKSLKGDMKSSSNCRGQFLVKPRIFNVLMYQSNRSFNIPPPPGNAPGI